MNEIEKKLIKKSQNGDIESFEILINQHQKYAYNIAYKMLGNEEDAKDSAQDALIKAYKNIKKFNLDSSFSTWLYRIVMNTCKDALRKQKVVYSLDEEIKTKDGYVQKEVVDHTNNPERVLQSNETSRIVEKAIGNLKEHYREIIVLRDIQGLSYEEISEVIDCPVGTIKSRLYRARLKLKQVLEKDSELLLKKSV